MNSNEYLLKILDELKINNGRIYKINENITDIEANVVRSYFLDKPEYYVELKKCLSCKNTWDIIIYLEKGEI